MIEKLTIKGMIGFEGQTAHCNQVIDHLSQRVWIAYSNLKTLNFRAVFSDFGQREERNKKHGTKQGKCLETSEKFEFSRLI